LKTIKNPVQAVISTLCFTYINMLIFCHLAYFVFEIVFGIGFQQNDKSTSHRHLPWFIDGFDNNTY